MKNSYKFYFCFIVAVLSGCSSIENIEKIKLTQEQEILPNLNLLDSGLESHHKFQSEQVKGLYKNSILVQNAIKKQQEKFENQLTLLQSQIQVNRHYLEYLYQQNINARINQAVDEIKTETAKIIKQINDNTDSINGKHKIIFTKLLKLEKDIQTLPKDERIKYEVQITQAKTEVKNYIYDQQQHFNEINSLEKLQINNTAVGDNIKQGGVTLSIEAIKQE